jgi:hypothetical protein
LLAFYRGTVATIHGIIHAMTKKFELNDMRSPGIVKGGKHPRNCELRTMAEELAAIAGLSCD